MATLTRAIQREFALYEYIPVVYGVETHTVRLLTMEAERKNNTDKTNYLQHNDFFFLTMCSYQYPHTKQARELCVGYSQRTVYTG